MKYKVKPNTYELAQILLEFVKGDSNRLLLGKILETLEYTEKQQGILNNLRKIYFNQIKYHLKNHPTINLKK